VARGILAAMPMTAAIVVLAVSILLLASAITILVMLRRGDGPVYSASRLYDANRRDAIRLLTGAELDAVPGEQWFLRSRREPIPDITLVSELRSVVFEALRAIVPADRDLAIESGHARVGEAVVLAAISTADIRASGALDGWDAPGLHIALVLVNPEPPGGDARRVALPVQILFPALERAGRADLVRRFAALRDAAAEPVAAEV
jgi:hypothetical protein